MKMSEDGLEKIIGRFGLYQTGILILLSVGRLPAEFALSNLVFLIPKPDYICLDDEAQNATNYCPCQNPLFDTSTIVSSITSDFKLICDKTALSSFTQSMLQAGIAVGSLFYGNISDRYGRKVGILLALCSSSIFGTLSSFSTQLWIVIVWRFFIGTAVGGAMLCCAVFMVELSGKSFRAQCAGLAEIEFVTGFLLMPIIAYFVREWKHLQMVISTPWVLVAVYYWLIPESPRWLITVGNKKEAVAILTHIAKRNNRPLENIEAIVDQIEAESLPEGPHQRNISYLDLFKTPRIRKFSIITPFLWVVCAFTFFGINQYIGRLKGNLYLNVFLTAAFQVPALALVVFGTFYFQRKTTITACYCVTTVALLGILIVPKSMDLGILTFAIIGQMGAFASFFIIYLFTTELFPTAIRNSAMGLCSVFGRVGGMLAPFVVNIGIEWVSILIFCVLALSAAILCCMLPETKDTILSNSIEQIERTHELTHHDFKKKNYVDAQCE